ncbi:hypothetical protein GIB67_019486 [Kingdonia uniflora]|uniref:Zinc finger CCCH domain-containing protein 44 n=1 Tax=Kingdonia uniflora TaxID=39325 RepID=A0A7J7N087_9MAGN|nr:hypothetical protein GIB67_019486 [Kingdonia uniflora]
MSWMIWQPRFEFFFQNKPQELLRISTVINNLILNEQVRRLERFNINVPYSIPTAGWAKINVDASLSKNTLFNGIGLVLRDDGNAFGAAHRSTNRFTTIEEGEALAVLGGVLWAREKEMQRRLPLKWMHRLLAPFVGMEIQLFPGQPKLELQQHHFPGKYSHSLPLISPPNFSPKQLQFKLNQSKISISRVSDFDSSSTRSIISLYSVRLCLKSTIHSWLEIIVMKGKRGRPPKVPKNAKKLEGEDVCFVCLDGGDLKLCQYKKCPKAYHVDCVELDEKFFLENGHQWHCGWHICSTCKKSAHWFCSTCMYSLCKKCLKDENLFIRRRKQGFCRNCIDNIMKIEKNEQDLNLDENIFLGYFKDYWIDVKGTLELKNDELSQMELFVTPSHNVVGDASGANPVSQVRVDLLSPLTQGVTTAGMQMHHGLSPSSSSQRHDVNGFSSTGVLPVVDAADNELGHVEVNEPPVAEASDELTQVRCPLERYPVLSHHLVGDASAVNLVQTEMSSPLAQGVSPVMHMDHKLSLFSSLQRHDVNGAISTGIFPAQSVVDNKVEPIEVSPLLVVGTSDKLTHSRSTLERSTTSIHHPVDVASAVNLVLQVRSEVSPPWTPGVSPVGIYMHHRLSPVSFPQCHDANATSTAILSAEGVVDSEVECVEVNALPVAEAVSVPMNLLVTPPGALSEEIVEVNEMCLSAPTVSLFNQEIECQRELCNEHEANGLSVSLVRKQESPKGNEVNGLEGSATLDRKLESPQGHEANGFGESAAFVHMQESSEGHETNDNQGSTSERSSKPIGVLSYVRKKGKRRSKSPTREEGCSCESIPNGTEWASKELLEFVAHVKNGNESILSHFEVQALVLEYIKRNNLRDADWKNQIICDSRLETLFKKVRVGHFEMLRHLQTHLLIKQDTPADLVRGAVVDSKRSWLEGQSESAIIRKMFTHKRRKIGEESESRVILGEPEHLQRLQDPLEVCTESKMDPIGKSEEYEPVSTENDIQGSTSSKSARDFSDITIIAGRATEKTNEPQNQVSVRLGSFHEPVLGSSSNISETKKLWHYQDSSGRIQGPFSMEQFRKWSTRYFPANMRIWRTTEKEEDSILMKDALDGKFLRVLVSSCDIRSYSKDDDSNRKNESNPDNGGNIHPVQSANSFFGTTSSEGGDDGMQQSAKSGSGINSVSRMTAITSLPNQPDSGILAKYGNGPCSNNLTSLQGWHYLDPSGRIQGPFSIGQFHKWSTRHFPANMRIWRTTEKQENSILMTDALDGKFREVLVSSCDVRTEATEDGDSNRKDGSSSDRNGQSNTPNGGKTNQVGSMDSGLGTHLSEGSNVGMQHSRKSGMQIGSVSEANASKSLSNQLDSGKLAKYGNVTYWNNLASLHGWSPKSGAGNNDILSPINQQVSFQSMGTNEPHRISLVDSLDHQLSVDHPSVPAGASSAGVDHVSNFISPSRITFADPISLTCAKSGDFQEPLSGNHGSSSLDIYPPGLFPEPVFPVSGTVPSSNWEGPLSMKSGSRSIPLRIKSPHVTQTSAMYDEQPGNSNTSWKNPQGNMMAQINMNVGAMQQDSNGAVWEQPVGNSGKRDQQNHSVNRFFDHPVRSSPSINRQSEFGSAGNTGGPFTPPHMGRTVCNFHGRGHGCWNGANCCYLHL